MLLFIKTTKLIEGYALHRIGEIESVSQLHNSTVPLSTGVPDCSGIKKCIPDCSGIKNVFRICPGIRMISKTVAELELTGKACLQFRTDFFKLPVSERSGLRLEIGRTTIRCPCEAKIFCTKS